jgi:hypothetical protein
MPSRAAHLIAFLSILAISVSCHIYIFRQLRSLIQRDFPHQKDRLITVAKWAFIYFDLPFIYLFLGRHITFDATVLTQFLMYPFAVWQMLMLVWAVILVPIGALRSKPVKRIVKSSVKPFARALRRLMRRLRRKNAAYPELIPATDEA